MHQHFYQQVNAPHPLKTLIEVLLVEDDPGDVELTLHALKKSKVQVNLNVVEDGVQAMAYLRKQDEYAQAPAPDLIMLDLNLPRKDGREVLNDMRSDDQLKHIPVVVLTTSDSDEDILRTYQLGANSYVTKPVGLKEFSQVVQALENFWFTIVKLPHS